MVLGQAVVDGHGAGGEVVGSGDPPQRLARLHHVRDLGGRGRGEQEEGSGDQDA